MKPPICKVCGSPHWTYEEHKPGAALDSVRKVGAAVLRNDALPAIPVETIPVRVTATVVGHVPTPPPDVPTLSLQESCECGKPREGRYKKCSACRKRAYRERSRG